MAFLLRVATLDYQSLWRDEVDAIRLSSWTLTDLVRGLFHSGHNGPLFFLLLRFWRSLTGDSEFALRYPSALLGTLTVPLAFILARHLDFRRPVSLLLALFCATSPYLVWYGQEAKMYTLLLAMVIFAFIAYLHALTGTKANGLWWIIFVIATSLTFYIHILSPLMLGVYIGVALFYSSHWRRQWLRWAISMGYLIVPYSPLMAWQAPLFWQGFTSGHPFYSLQQEIFILVQLYSGGLIRFAPGDLTLLLPQSIAPSLKNFLNQVPYLYLAGIFLYLFLFLCGLFLYPPQNRSRISKTVLPIRYLTNRRWLLALWSLLPPLLVFLISLRVAVFEDRYLIYITPAFYLLIGLGLLMLAQYLPRLAGVCLALILALNLMGIWQQQRRPIKADFRAAAHYLAQQSDEPLTIMVQMPYLQHTLNYYYLHEYTLLEGLWTNNNKSEIEVDLEMSEMTSGLTNMWLVVSEEAMWDQRHLTRQWLDTHADLIDEAHFMRVDLYHYRFKPEQ